VLGIWWQETEGAKFWLAVLNDLHQRGVKDVLICCVDGLAGFAEAIEAVFPAAWVQTCIVHQIRTSMRYVAYKDRKAIARDLKLVYRAVNPDAAWEALEAFDERWGERYPMIAESWRARWEHIAPFLALPGGPAPGRLHHQQHREPQSPDPQGDQDPRPLPRRAGRHQAHRPRHSKGRNEMEDRLQLDRRTTRPQDPLRRPTARLTVNTVPSASHTEARTPSKHAFALFGESPGDQHTLLGPVWADREPALIVGPALIASTTKPGVELVLDRALNDQPRIELGQLRQRLPRVLAHPTASSRSICASISADGGTVRLTA
jgi:Transposase, Mutator family